MFCSVFDKEIGVLVEGLVEERERFTDIDIDTDTDTDIPMLQVVV